MSISIELDTTNKIFSSIESTVESIHFNNNRTKILVSTKIIAPFRKLVGMVFPNITVLSLNEISIDI